MFLLQLNKAEFEKIMLFLDAVLKKEGLALLPEVVEVYNIMQTASQALDTEKFKELVPDQEFEGTKENG